MFILDRTGTSDERYCCTTFCWYLTHTLKEQEKLDVNVKDAVHYLNYVVAIVSWTVIVTLIFLLINENTGNVIPTWVIFITIWVGHLILFVVSVRIVRLVFHSLLAKERCRANGIKIQFYSYPVFGWLYSDTILSTFLTGDFISS